MNFANWKWLNESTMTEENGVLKIYAPAHTDWYNNPVPDHGKLEAPIGDAPVLYTQVEGDFIFRAKVTPEFTADFDACALMVIADGGHWIKAAFEKSDFGPGSAICGVTNGLTDDSNGWTIPQDFLWLQLTRVGDVFAMHFSLDGEVYYTCRVFSLALPETVKVGLEAQCPRGCGGMRSFSDVTLQCRTAENIRAGK